MGNVEIALVSITDDDDAWHTPYIPDDGDDWEVRVTYCSSCGIEIRNIALAEALAYGDVVIDPDRMCLTCASLPSMN